MWKFAAIALAALFWATSIPANAQVDPYLRQKQEQMLYPSVTVRSGDMIGSGTVIFSKKVRGDDGEQVETYLLTNHHVIANALNAKMPVRVEFIQYDSNFHETGTLSKIADVYAADEEHDIALLRLHDHEHLMPYVAHLALPGVTLQVMEHIWTIGSTLDQPPFPNEGMIATKDMYLPIGTRYIRTTMFIQHGGSGGGLYHFDPVHGYEFIGMVSAIFVHDVSMNTKRADDRDEKKSVHTADAPKAQEEGNISFSIPPKIWQQFLQEVGRKLKLDFFE